MLTKILGLFQKTKSSLTKASKVWPTTSAELSKEKFYANSREIIDKSTAITYLGSCFAFEIANWLQKNQYN